MKGVFGAIITFFILLFAFAKWGPTIPISILSQQKGEPLIVQGTGKVTVTPDIAKVNVGIQEQGIILKQVQNSLSKKSKTLTDELKKLGIEEKDIKTTSYSLYPQYDYTDPSSKITGYQVSIDYEVTVRDFDKVNDVLTAATGSGANVASGVSFEVNEKTKKEKLQEAREEAINEAKGKAEGLAKAANITLGKIINISEEQGGQPFPISLMERSGKEGDTATPKPEITPGQTEISVTISISFEIR